LIAIALYEDSLKQEEQTGNGDSSKKSGSIKASPKNPPKKNNREAD